MHSGTVLHRLQSLPVLQVFKEQREGDVPWNSEPAIGRNILVSKTHCITWKHCVYRSSDNAYLFHF